MWYPIRHLESESLGTLVLSLLHGVSCAFVLSATPLLPTTSSGSTGGAAPDLSVDKERTRPSSYDSPNTGRVKRPRVSFDSAAASSAGSPSRGSAPPTSPSPNKPRPPLGAKGTTVIVLIQHMTQLCKFRWIDFWPGVFYSQRHPKRAI